MMSLTEVLDLALPYADTKDLVRQLCKAVIEECPAAEDAIAHKIFDRVVVPIGDKAAERALAKMRRVH